MSKSVSSRSIAELEGIEWEPPEAGASRVIRRCHEIRRKALSSLTATDLRLVIGQDIGLPFVMPLALNIVEKDPLIETEHYKGDLLVAVLNASAQFLHERPDLVARIKKVLESLPSALDALDHIDYDTASEALDEAIASFRRS